MSVSDDSPEFDTLAFRRALGMFATGITVVTAQTPDGRRIGLTVNSFNSVSLTPPLVLWSLARHLPVLADFEQCSHYAINVLATHQQPLSQRFATRADDKFAELDVREGVTGAPILRDALFSLDCRVIEAIPASTHSIFLCEVVDAKFAEASPLLYFNGRFAAVL